MYKEFVQLWSSFSKLVINLCSQGDDCSIQSSHNVLYSMMSLLMDQLVNVIANGL